MIYSSVLDQRKYIWKRNRFIAVTRWFQFERWCGNLDCTDQITDRRCALSPKLHLNLILYLELGPGRDAW